MEIDRSQQQEALRQVRAFVFKNEYFGIPANIFYGIIGMSVAIGAIFRSFFSPFIVLVYLLAFGVPMYHIHKFDPYGLKVWIRAIRRRHTWWCSGIAAPRELIIFSREEADESD